MKGIKTTALNLIISLAFPFFIITGANAQQTEGQNSPIEKIEQIIPDFLTANEEIEFYVLEESLNVKVDIASLFNEDEIFVGSSVSSITPNKWKILGARRYYEAMANEISVMAYPTMLGIYGIAIRGYPGVNSDKGIAVLIDGVPCNEMSTGSALYVVPNFELGVLDRIEMIKGPGSAIYGSDAFHGVISMKTFESEKDLHLIEGAVAYPLYGDTNMKFSQGFAENMVRVNIAAALSCQGDQDIEYDYIDSDTGETGTGKYELQHRSQSGLAKVIIQPFDKLLIRAGAYFANAEHEDYPGPYNMIDLSSMDEVTNLKEYDYTNAKSLFLMGNGSIVYNLPDDISIEASGFYWKNNPESKTPFTATGIDYQDAQHEYLRYGTSMIIKQPDNPVNLQWLLAYSYNWMKIEKSGYDLVVGSPLSFPPQGKFYFTENVEGSSRDINSIFGHLKWGIIDKRLYLLGGGRLDKYSDFGYQVTPRGGCIILPSENTVIKGLWGRAFRAPSAVESEGKRFYVKGNKDIEPETIDIFEIICMYRDKKLKASVTGFYSYWQNGILMEPVDTPTIEYSNIFVNKGKNHSYGGELTLFYNLNPFALDISFSYVESWALNVTDTYDPSETTDKKYDIFPTYSIIAGLYYTFAPYNINFFLNNKIYLDMKEIPSSQKTSAEDLPPYYRLDLNISKIFSGNVEFYLDLRNLLNRKNHVPSIWGVEKGYAEQGFSAMLRAGYKL